ncbi:MAG TPA: excisionase [Acidimicrobiia bacterium]|nr:excisionase [Acidimicrobiia bacterium]
MIRMAVEIPGMAEAAERLGITTRQMVQLVYDREIRYVIVDGIPRIPEDAIEEYRRKAS